MQRINTWICGLLMLLASVATAGAAPAGLDWRELDLLPVLHNGRVMPLETFARNSADLITGRESPRLDLKASVTKADLASPDFASARSLFPDDKPRKFKPSELLLSWLLEPEKWDRVPFIEAKHQDVRKLLGLPLKNEEGDPIGFVSPHDLKKSEGFQKSLMDIVKRKQEARRTGGELEMSEVDKQVDGLWQSLQLWRGLALSNALDAEASGRFHEALESVGRVWQEAGPDLALFLDNDNDAAGLRDPIKQAEAALQNLATLAEKNDLTAAEIEPPATTFAQNTARLADYFNGFLSRMTKDPPKQGDPEKLKQTMATIAGRMDRLAAAAKRLQTSIYLNSDPLRVAPALSAAALEKERDPMEKIQPWIDLETLLYGTPGALVGYPPADVAGVRDAFHKLSQVYADRNERPNDFTAALAGFAGSLRKLGEDVEPLRAQLPIEGIDQDLINYTKYPAVGATAVEVRYNRLQPFQWSWVINLVATCIFTVYMIGIRRRGLFNLGLLVLGLGLFWAAYGFYMRVLVTGWAPVTNMYETVVFVPFFVAMLGAWLALLPVTLPGLNLAWRLTAVPGTWEATELTHEQTRTIAANQWTTISLALLIPRIALSGVLFWMLAVAPYSAGGRTVINLLPNIDAGQRWPDTNDIMTWAVGLCVLIPTVWYLPRVVMSAVVSLVTIPMGWQGQRRKLFDEAHTRWPFCLAATFIAFFGAAVASYAPVLDGNFHPLQPVLRDNFWLLIHVLTIVSSYGAGALAWGLGNIALAYYLFGKYRAPEPNLARFAAHLPAGGQPVAAATTPYRAPEETVALSGFVYKGMQVAVVLLAAGTILGALWADVAWGRFWGWDPKEVWALISLLIYLAILHGRYAGLFGNFGLCVGSVLGFSAIVMSWYGVNFVLGVGLHSYGFGSGGQLWVFGAVLLNWLFVGCAAYRYRT